MKGKKILIIGGGYLGLEVASVCSSFGMNTTVVEGADRILKRVAGEPTAAYFRKIFSIKGVKIIENDFKRPKGVNRSHINQRSETSRIMFEKDSWDMDSWWEFYEESDKCILATSSENMDKDPEIIFAKVPEGLFKTRGFAYIVKDEEKAFLKKISANL